MVHRSGLLRKTLVSLCLWSMTLPPAAWSGPQSERPINPSDGVPTRPTAPPSLSRKAPEDVFSCHRKYLFQGKTIACDSNLNLDGEGLRAIVSGTPAALKELNLYQANRRSAQATAYVATAGLAIAALSFFIGKSMRDDHDTITDSGRALRNIGFTVGFGTSAISIGYGLVLLKKNEKHLGRSVQLFNEANPSTPIELQFSTGLDLW